MSLNNEINGEETDSKDIIFISRCEMKNKLKNVKVSHIVIIILLVILAAIPIFLSSLNNAGGDNYTAVIRVNGEVVHEMELRDDGETESYEFADGHRYNVVYREGMEVDMHDANCEDSLCLRQGAIEKPGETIVCLPNRVLVEVRVNN